MGNPRMLAAVESIYGPDFVPFGDSYVMNRAANSRGLE
jgi:hypothetical protein